MYVFLSNSYDHSKVTKNRLLCLLMYSYTTCEYLSEPYILSIAIKSAESNDRGSDNDNDNGA